METKTEDGVLRAELKKTRSPPEKSAGSLPTEAEDFRWKRSRRSTDEHHAAYAILREAIEKITAAAAPSPSS